eukprot:scaffold4722_cov103-Isochrysis_galbana.AAC.1
MPRIRSCSAAMASTRSRCKKALDWWYRIDSCNWRTCAGRSQGACPGGRASEGEGLGKAQGMSERRYGGVWRVAGREPQGGERG